MANKLKASANQTRDDASVVIDGNGSLSITQSSPGTYVISINTPTKKKRKEETKKRFDIMLLPSQYEKIQKIAYVQRKSASVIVREALDIYIDGMDAVLEEYDTIIS